MIENDKLKTVEYIRRYGLYSSRSRGKWDEQEYIVRLAPDGWKEKKELEAACEGISVENTESPVGTKKQRSTRARLIKKVYGTDPLTCPRCGSEIKIIAIIMDPCETEKILQHLVKIGRVSTSLSSNCWLWWCVSTSLSSNCWLWWCAPPNFDVDCLN